MMTNESLHHPKDPSGHIENPKKPDFPRVAALQQKQQRSEKPNQPRASSRFRATHVTMAHGAGGRATAALVKEVFLDAYGGRHLNRLEDAAILPLGRSSSLDSSLGASHLAFSCDSFVVTPPCFPGGSLGRLAVCGTVNDLAMAGAIPSWLAISWVIEEGTPIQTLRTVAHDIATAATEADIEIVTGDTKVVERGAADGVLLTTAGVGICPAGRELGAERIQPGDKLLLSGSMGDHGMAVMLARGDLAINADIRSDCAPLGKLAAGLLTAAPNTRWMRDPTRGGVAMLCHELAAAAEHSVLLREQQLPVRPAVRAACELLGIDPLHVANEGKLLAVVPPAETEDALAALRSSPLGKDAVLIGEISPHLEPIVLLETPFGGTRLLDIPVGNPLPRIC